MDAVVKLSYFMRRNIAHYYLFFCILYQIHSAQEIKLCGINSDLSKTIQVRSATECGHKCTTYLSCSNFVLCDDSNTPSCIRYVVDTERTLSDMKCPGYPDQSIKCTLYKKESELQSTTVTTSTTTAPTTTTLDLCLVFPQYCMPSG